MSEEKQAEREHADDLYAMLSEAVIKYVSMFPEDEHKGPALIDLIRGHKEMFPEKHKFPDDDKPRECIITVDKGAEEDGRTLAEVYAGMGYNVKIRVRKQKLVTVK